VNKNPNNKSKIKMISNNKKSHAKNLCEHNNKSKIKKLISEQKNRAHAKILCIPEFDLDLDETVNEVVFTKE